MGEGGSQKANPLMDSMKLNGNFQRGEVGVGSKQEIPVGEYGYFLENTLLCCVEEKF